MTRLNGTIRRLVAQGAIAWPLLVVLGAFVLSRSHSAIAQWVEPVRAEIPGWTWVGLGVPTGEVLPDYALIVEPDVLRAARLMSPTTAQAGEFTDHWWFPARFVASGTTYQVEAQFAGSPNDAASQDGLRVRFLGQNRPSGVRELELHPTRLGQHARDLVASEAARDLGLIAAPAGFARLRINGGQTQPVLWREGNSAAMLQRLGFAAGEIFRSTLGTARGDADERLPDDYISTLERRASRAQAAALRRFVELVRSANDDRFRAEIAGLVNVEQVLAWNALTSLFDRAEDCASPDWYFDPITGLLEPVVRTLASAPTATACGLRDAHQLIARLLEVPELRARHAALLRDWVGITRSAPLETADARLGHWVSRLAASSGSFERAAELARLAELRRTTRHALHAHARILRQETTRGPLGASRIARATQPVPPQQRERMAAWVAASGLHFVARGNALILPAGTHHVDRTLVVPASHRLVIEPGARLVMAPDVSILTFQRLEAVGTRHAPIEIRALDPRKPWGSIGVARAVESSELAYVTVSGGSDAKLEGIEFTGQLAFNASDVVIRDSDVRDAHGDDAMSVRRAFFQVARSRFIDNASDGLDAEWSSGSVEHSLFANNGDDGLDLGTSEARVHRGWFRRMGDKAISAGERSRVTVSDSQLVDSQIAIASKEDSRVEIHGSEFRRNEIGISLYRDNLVFGSGFGSVSGGLFAENLRDFAVESGSGLTLNGVERLDSGEMGVVIGLRDTAGATQSALQ